MSTELIVALDYNNLRDTLSAVDELADRIHFYKVGLELFLHCGNTIIDALLDRNKKIFLDLKLHDISNTMEQAFQYILSKKIYMTTVHISAGENALQQLHRIKKAKNASTKIIGVTALTNLDNNDLSVIYNQKKSSDLVFNLTSIAVSAHLDGIVCSAQEAGYIRQHFGNTLLIVCPGIRLAGDNANDQKRVSSPSAATKAGANYLVLGRSILQSNNRRNAAERVLEEIELGNR